MIPLPRELCKAVVPHHCIRYDARPLQDGLGGCPWRVAVASIMLCRARKASVSYVLRDFFRNWPTASVAAVADAEHVASVIQPLGLYNSRARQLTRLSMRWETGAFDDMRDLPGVGPYVADAVGLVCFGCTDVVSGDLAMYAFARSYKRSGLRCVGDAWLLLNADRELLAVYKDPLDAYSAKTRVSGSAVHTA